MDWCILFFLGENIFLYILVFQERIKDLNKQADAFIESDVLDTEDIKHTKTSINERYERVVTLAEHRRARLDEANTLHQFFRDIDDEEAWIK